MSWIKSLKFGDVCDKIVRSSSNIVDKVKLGKNIKKLRQEKGISQDRLSKLTDLSLNTVVTVKSGANLNPTIETLTRIAKALEVGKEETERCFKEYGPNKLPEAKVDSLMEELIKDGESGFVIESDIEKLVEAIGKVDQIDRSKVRKHVEDNFSKERMVDEYEKLYYELCQKRA